MFYRRHRAHRKTRRRARFFLLLLIFIGIFCYAESRLPAVKADVQQATLRRFALQKISETVGSYMERQPISTDTDTVALDTYALSTLKGELTAALEKSLSETAVAWVPLGNLSGAAMLNGHGPRIPVFFPVEGVALLEFRSDLNAAGINRTRYSVTLHITAELYSASAAFSDVVTVSTSYPLYEGVTQGEVPRYAAGLPVG